MKRITAFIIALCLIPFTPLFSISISASAEAPELVVNVFTEDNQVTPVATDTILFRDIARYHMSYHSADISSLKLTQCRVFNTNNTLGVYFGLQKGSTGYTYQSTVSVDTADYTHFWIDFPNYFRAVGFGGGPTITHYFNNDLTVNIYLCRSADFDPTVYPPPADFGNAYFNIMNEQGTYNYTSTVDFSDIYTYLNYHDFTVDYIIFKDYRMYIGGTDLYYYDDFLYKTDIQLNPNFIITFLVRDSNNDVIANASYPNDDSKISFTPISYSDSLSVIGVVTDSQLFPHDMTINLYNNAGTVLLDSATVSGWNYLDYAIRVDLTEVDGVQTADIVLSIRGETDLEALFNISNYLGTSEDIVFNGIAFSPNKLPDVYYNNSLLGSLIYENSFYPESYTDTLDFYLCTSDDIERVVVNNSVVIKNNVIVKTQKFDDVNKEYNDKVSDFKDNADSAAGDVVADLPTYFEGEGYEAVVNVFNTIYELPMIVTFMVISMSVVLVSFVLFGKK